MGRTLSAYMAVFFALLAASLPCVARAVSLYNLTGSAHGFGDVTGPFLLAKQDALRGEPVYLFIDERAEMVLRAFTQAPDGPLNLVDGMRIVREADLANLPPLDRVFEPFFLARGKSPTFRDPLPKLKAKPSTVMVMNDLHAPFEREGLPRELVSSGLSEVKTSVSHLFFSPAGLGSQKLGILTDETVEPYVEKSIEEQRALAAEHFAEGPIRNVLTRMSHPNALLSFGYGTHNEVFATDSWDPYPGQFKTLVRGMIEIAREAQKPVIYFTPNKLEVLREALAGRVPARTHLLTEAQLASRAHLQPGEIYLVETARLSHKQFVALTAATDIPYLVEGDSALSAAVRLGKPFVMLKAPWGYFGIENMREALKEAGAKWAEAVYPRSATRGKDIPDFSRLQEIYEDKAVFQNLRFLANNWSANLRAVLHIAEGRSSDALTAIRRVKDPVLLYSWARDLLAREKIDRKDFELLVSEVPQQQTIENLIQLRISPAPGAGPRCSELFTRP